MTKTSVFQFHHNYRARESSIFKHESSILGGEKITNFKIQSQDFDAIYVLVINKNNSSRGFFN